MSRGDPNWPDFVEFVRERPPSVQALMREWPPLCVVKTRPGVVLLIPAPGVEGVVESYYENGTLGVSAPMSIPHPRHGFHAPAAGRDIEVGERVKAQNVRPDVLRLVREELWTRADVEEALRGG